MAYGFTATIVTRVPGGTDRVRTFPLGNESADARREVLDTVAPEFRAPFLEAEDDVEEGRRVDPRAFLTIGADPDGPVRDAAGFVGATEVADSTASDLEAIRRHLRAAIAAGSEVEAYVEIV